MTTTEFLVRDGVRLGYSEVGSGEPAMVFVHGWTCDMSHFVPQVEHYAPSRRCVSMDLRGHGSSDAPEQEYNIPSFADDIGWMCDQLRVKDAMLVGHSMGGAIVLALVASRPELARGVLMLDSAILFSAESHARVAKLADAFAGPGGVEALREVESEQFFESYSDPALKERLLEAACKTPQHVVASAMRNLITFEADEALRKLKCPLLHVASDRVLTNQSQLLQWKPDVMTGKTVGAGHFHQLEVPEQVNPMIDRFLALHGLAV